MLFAAGVMLSTSVFNLILPSLNDYEEKLVSISGIVFGALCVSIINVFVDRMIFSYEKKMKNTIENKNEINKILLFVSAIAIHNFPEGIAAGVGFGTDNISDALTVAGSIALQNLPEGMIVIAPMLSIGISKGKTMIIAVLTAVSEIIGTLSGYYAVSLFNSVLPFMLSFAGGTMLYVICNDIIPDTQKESENKFSSFALLFGFCLMLVFDYIVN